jgi:hypothetical protein
MANENDVSTATAEGGVQPKQTATPPSAQASGMGAGIAGDARPGASAQGTDYGNPYDDTAPPWSTYQDPQAAPAQAQQEAKAAATEARSSARGAKEYVFTGSTNPGDQTAALTLPDGTEVVKGEPVNMTEDEVKQLEELGYAFEKQ